MAGCDDVDRSSGARTLERAGETVATENTAKFMRRFGEGRAGTSINTITDLVTLSYAGAS